MLGCHKCIIDWNDYHLVAFLIKLYMVIFKVQSKYIFFIIFIMY